MANVLDGINSLGFDNFYQMPSKPMPVGPVTKGPNWQVNQLPNASKEFNQFNNGVAYGLGTDLLRKYTGNITPPNGFNQDVLNLQNFMKTKNWLPTNYKPTGFYDYATHANLMQLNKVNPPTPRPVVQST